MQENSKKKHLNIDKKLFSTKRKDIPYFCIFLMF